MMQLMPSTAAALGVNPHDVLANIKGGIRYLQEQLQNFGDKAKALAAYNWGPRHVADAVERWGSDWLSHAPRARPNAMWPRSLPRPAAAIHPRTYPTPP